MSNKLLVICGPTATGKTKLGIYLANKFNGEIISADSRQVYKFMDIGTGKEWDLPAGRQGILIHGYDIVNPKEDFSVSQYLKFAKKVIKGIKDKGKLPILVGGTGLYIKAVVDGIDTVNVPKNIKLRKSLEEKNIDELFEKLATLDSSKAASMNSSDRKNSRRLIRAIEVAIWKINNEKSLQNIKRNRQKLNVLFIGLKCPKDIILERILSRVEKRIEEGFIDEMESLLRMGVSWKMQSMKSLGYSEAEGFFKNGLTYEDFVYLWQRNEFKYYKRQMTWFNKEKRINWFDISKISNWQEKVEKLVKKWDNDSHGQKS